MKKNYYKILIAQSGIGIFILSLFFSTLSLQAASQTPSSDTIPEINYAYPVMREIAAIRFVGGEGYDPMVLNSISGLREGDLIEVPGIRISEAIRKFMQHGHFSSCKIYADKVEGNKIWLTVELTKHPRISSLTILGISKKSEKTEVEQKIGLRTGMQFSPNIERRTQKLIQRYYDEKGYNDMKSSIMVTPDLSKENFVHVEININKNNKTKITHIHFEGNESLSDNRLKRAMKKTNETFDLFSSKWQSSILEIFSSKKFIQKEYKEDLKNIISAYHDAGYRDAEIESATINSISDNRIDINIKIKEGKKYHIKDIRVVGNTKYPSEMILNTLGIRSGDVYDQGRLSKRIYVEEDAVANLYYNNGYIFANIDPVETFVQDDSVSLDLRIIEGPQATINRVNIKGNPHLYEEVVRREIYTKPGKLFSKEDLMNSWMILNQLGHFNPEKSIPTPIPNPQTGTVDIDYNLTPQNNDKFEGSMGWSQVGVMIRFGVSFNNFSMRNLFNKDRYAGKVIPLPQGDGQQLSVNVSTSGKYYQQVGIQFTDPWFGRKRPNYFMAALSYSRQTAIDTRFYNNRIGSYYNPYGYGYGYGGYDPYSNGYGYGGYSGYNYGGAQDLMEKAYNPNQSLQMLSATVGFGKRLSWPDNWFVLRTSFNYSFYKLNDWVYDTFEGFHQGLANDLNLSISLSRSSIDNPIFTRRGSDFSFTATLTPPYSLWDGVNYADPTLAAKDRHRMVEYHKWRISGKVFSPLMNPALNKYAPIAMARFDMGIIGSYNPYKRSPFGTYYMGGDIMGGSLGGYMNETIPLRGYRNGSIAGNNYNYAYSFLRLVSEIRFPIFFQNQYNVWAVAFAEAGNAWRNPAYMNPFNLKRSAGVGFRITLPMLGMIGVDWGYGFDKPDGSSSRGGGNFHLVLGQEF